MAKSRARAAKTRKSANKRGKKPARAATPAKRRSAGKKAKRSAKPAARKTSAPKGKASKVKARKVASTTSARPVARAAKAPARKVPALNRARRTVSDDAVTPSLPSSLDLDRTASAARTGRRELHEKMHELTQTGPAMTGGDIDADWESAYSVGDEAPGGDNPTPDQDIVDDIGRAIGVQYEDNEELKSESKIGNRDRHRWELDPASSDDYNDR
jgi:hypothetical protein